MMSIIQRAANIDWTNYHATRFFSVADAATFVRDADPAPDGPTMFAGTGAVLKRHLAALKGRASVGVTAAAWSLSELVGCEDRQLDTAQLDGIGWVEEHHLHRRSRIKPREAVFVGGGIHWQALVEFTESARSPRSIRTCGSYLQQSVAGSVATSTGGSRLGFGGVQNQVLGIHLVTGADESVWIERRSDPVLGHIAADFADAIIRDDAIFEDCLVHLGGMGIVNGMIVETYPNDRYTMLKTRKAVDQRWLEWVRDGDFDAIAHWLGHDLVPVYYEVQVDPFGLFTSDAIHTMYFQTDDLVPPIVPMPNIPVSAVLGQLSHQIVTHPPRQSDVQSVAGDPAPYCTDFSNALRDLFKFYSTCEIRTVDPNNTGAQTWGEIHALLPAPEQQALVYTAAFAFPRSEAVRALPAICAGVKGQPQQFLYTMRFVTHAAGTLAFARFGESIVLDFEGLKPTEAIARDAAFSLGKAHAALDAANIPFSPHWGKLGAITAARVEDGFGNPASSRSPLGRWRKTRSRLLTARSRHLMSNDALRKWGLV